MGCCGGKNKAAAESRMLEQERQQKITSGMANVNQVFDQFGPEFYNRRRNEYIQYAMPKLGAETRDVNKAAKFSLANRGLLNSSAGTGLMSSLGRATAEAQADVGTAAEQQAQGLRKEVEGQRSNVIAQLQASGDPAFAAQQALSTASQFTAPSTFAPVGGFLNNWANLWLAQRQAEATKQSTQMYNTRNLNYGTPSAASYTVR